MRFYKAIIVNVLLWGGESWAIKSKKVHDLRVFQFRCLRCILKINIMHKVSRMRILGRRVKCRMLSKPWTSVASNGSRSSRSWTSLAPPVSYSDAGCMAKYTIAMESLSKRLDIHIPTVKNVSVRHRSSKMEPR